MGEESDLLRQSLATMTELLARRHELMTEFALEHRRTIEMLRSSLESSLAMLDRAHTLEHNQDVRDSSDAD